MTGSEVNVGGLNELIALIDVLVAKKRGADIETEAVLKLVADIRSENLSHKIVGRGVFIPEEILYHTGRERPLGGEFIFVIESERFCRDHAVLRIRGEQQCVGIPFNPSVGGSRKIFWTRIWDETSEIFFSLFLLNSGCCGCHSRIEAGGFLALSLAIYRVKIGLLRLERRDRHNDRRECEKANGNFLKHEHSS